MTTLYLTQGLPGSGKSTWALDLVSVTASEKDATKRTTRVNRDDLRFMMYGKYWDLPPGGENAVTQAERSLVGRFLRENNVVVDATHLNPKVVNEWRSIIRWFKKDRVTLKIVKFELPLVDLIHRDFVRMRDGGRGVGSQVILDMAKRYGIGEDGKIPDVYRES